MTDARKLRHFREDRAEVDSQRPTRHYAHYVDGCEHDVPCRTIDHCVMLDEEPDDLSEAMDDGSDDA